MSKIKEKEMQADYIGNEAGPDAIASTLDPKVFEVYSQYAHYIMVLSYFVQNRHTS